MHTMDLNRRLYPIVIRGQFRAVWACLETLVWCQRLRSKRYFDERQDNKEQTVCNQKQKCSQASEWCQKGWAKWWGVKSCSSKEQNAILLRTVFKRSWSRKSWLLREKTAGEMVIRKVERGWISIVYSCREPVSCCGEKKGLENALRNVTS